MPLLNKIWKNAKLPTIIAIAMIIFIGCGDKDEPTNNEIVGTIWKQDSVVLNMVTTLNFITKTKGNQILYDAETEEKIGQIPFTYNYQKPNIRIDGGYNPTIGYYYLKGVINGNKMTLNYYIAETNELLFDYTEVLTKQ